MSQTDVSDEAIWLALADLFFLDTESTDAEFARVAELLRSNGWSKEKTEQVLVELIAPNFGANLGYLIFPAFGEWAGFDSKQVAADVLRSQARRHRYPKWYFYLSDLWSQYMLRELGLPKLMERL